MQRLLGDTRCRSPVFIDKKTETRSICQGKQGATGKVSTRHKEEKKKKHEQHLDYTVNSTTTKIMGIYLIAIAPTVHDHDHHHSKIMITLK